MLASFARMTGCEVNGLPNTIRCVPHLGRKHQSDDNKIKRILLEAFLDDQSLRRNRSSDHHPSLVVKVAEDDLHPFPDVAKGVRDWYADLAKRKDHQNRHCKKCWEIADFLKCDVGSTSNGRIRGLYRFSGDTWSTFDEEDDKAGLEIGFGEHGKKGIDGWVLASVLHIVVK